MRFTTSLAALAALLSIVDARTFHRDPTSQALMPRGYIVEFEKSGVLGSGERSDGNANARFARSMRQRKIDYKVRYQFEDPRLFLGASVVLHNDGDLERLVNTAGVKAVTPIRLYASPKVDPKEFNAKTDVGDAFSTHIMTGVDKLHAEGFLGEGITVGILDTGVDYLHPSLGKGFGAGFPVSGGYDFVGDAYNGSNTPAPDDDPYSGCNGHGTHVAGTVIADDKKFGFTGVVPKANVWAGRVFGCDGSTGNDVIISALSKAFLEAKVDIISMSLGGSSGWVEAPDAVVASRISDFGVPVVIANGNDGANGAFYPSSPGTALNAIAVGSVENTLLPGFKMKVNDGKDDITYLSTLVWDAPNLPIYAVAANLNVTDDACAPLPSSTPDLSDKLVLVGRGTCTFVEKLAHVQAKGAKYVMVYNNLNAPLYMEAQANLTTGFLFREDGLRLVADFLAKKPTTVDFSNKNQINSKNPNAGRMSDFSNYGPDFNMHLKPAISAPGGNILSTWPLSQGGYTIISGTSMATPFIAGSIALIKSARRQLKLDDLSTLAMRSLMASTAQPVPSNADGSRFQTIAQQGAGLINVYNAVHTNYYVTPSSLLLNDTANFNQVQTIKIKNVGKKAATWRLSNVPAETINTFGDDSFTVAVSPIPPVVGKGFVATTSFSSGKLVHVPAGSTVSVKVTFAAPKGADASVYPIYSGFIKLENTKASGRSFTVPYLGVLGSLKDIPVLTASSDASDPWPALLAGNDSVNGQTFNLSPKANKASAPTLFYRFNMGTALVSVDYVPADTTFTASIPLGETSTKNGRFDARTQKLLAASNANFADVKVTGNAFTAHYQPRNIASGNEATGAYNSLVLDGQLSDHNKTLADGQYRILLRAQRLSTEGVKSKDYDSWLSNPFTVKRA